MIVKILSSLIRKAIVLAIVLGVILLVGYCSADHKDYPGKAAFEKANSLLTTNSEGGFHGDSADTTTAASAFGTSMKTMQSALFSGGSGRSFATGGTFVTYVKHTPGAVVILCHVPELRNYKDEKTRNALAQIAWASGKAVAAKIPGVKGSDTLMIGLRGFASYGPIWEGTVSGEATKKTDDLNEVKRLYPFFVSPSSP